MAHYYQLLSELYSLGFKQTKCVHMEAKEKGDPLFKDARECHAYDWPGPLVEGQSTANPFMRVHVTFKSFESPHVRHHMPTLHAVHIAGTDVPEQRVSANNAIDAAKRFVRIHDKRP